MKFGAPLGHAQPVLPPPKRGRQQLIWRTWESICCHQQSRSPSPALKHYHRWLVGSCHCHFCCSIGLEVPTTEVSIVTESVLSGMAMGSALMVLTPVAVVAVVQLSVTPLALYKRIGESREICWSHAWKLKSTHWTHRWWGCLLPGILSARDWQFQCYITSYWHVCPVKGQMQSASLLESKFRQHFVKRKSYFPDCQWATEPLGQKSGSLLVCVLKSSACLYQLKSGPLIPVVLLRSEWGMKSSENLWMSISQWFVQSRWTLMGKFHLLKGKFHTKLASTSLSRPWFSFPTPAGSFRPKKW